MKILFLNLFYYPNLIGGAEHSLRLLAEGLVKNGHEVAVITYDKPLLKEKYENIEGVKIFRLENNLFLRRAFGQKLKKKERIIYYLEKYINRKVSKQVSNIVEFFHPDILHTQNFFPAYIYRFKKKYGFIIFHTLRDYYLLDPRSEVKKDKRLISFFHRQYGKYFVNKYVDCVTGPSDFILEKHLSYGMFRNCEKQVIPNAINGNLEDTKRIVEERKNRDGEVVRFLYVGSLTQNKGIINLLEAFSLCEGNIQLDICGTGPLIELVWEYVKYDKRIKYHGQLLPEQIKQMYIANDILVVPSLWEEPFGRVVIEAAQYGLPIIGANRGGIREIVEKTGFGVLYNSDDVIALKTQIIKFSCRSVIRKYFAAIIEGISSYYVENQVAQFINLYKKKTEDVQ